MPLAEARALANTSEGFDRIRGFRQPDLGLTSLSAATWRYYHRSKEPQTDSAASTIIPASPSLARSSTTTAFVGRPTMSLITTRVPPAAPSLGRAPSRCHAVPLVTTKSSLNLISSMTGPSGSLLSSPPTMAHRACQRNSRRSLVSLKVLIRHPAAVFSYVSW